MELKNIIEKYNKELIDNLSRLVVYNSVLDKGEDNAPYGIETAKCLEEALNIAKDYGFKTKNLDYHCGYAEIGEGKEIIGILTHLDIVPAGNGWETDPFTATIKDNKIYGRGTSDDKGAASASLLALKIIKELNIPLNKRIRLIFGCKEETGSECMLYYVKKEGYVDIGFTPDGSFPLIHGEKGQIKAFFKTTDTFIEDIKGGIVPNAVSDNCTVTIKRNSYDKEILKKYFINNNIEFNILENADLDIIQVKGISAHGSLPELGVNAISYAIMGLKKSGYKDNFVDFYTKFIGLETNGESLGIKCSDEYGELTLVNGMISKETGQVTGTLDIRIPVTLSVDNIVNKLRDGNYGNVELEVEKFGDPLFFSLDSDLVKNLLEVYQQVTSDEESKPIVMGGGTYAKTMKNCIAFGCSFPNVNNQIHNSNEFVGIDELMLQVEIYVNALIKLNKM